MSPLLGFFAGPARLKGLLIGAVVLLVLCLSLITWALFERSGRLTLEVKVVSLQAQTDVLADSLGRCNVGVANAAKAGQGAIAETKRLLGMAERALERNAAVRDEIRGIVAKPAPVRPDGKPKDCGDALAELKARVRP